MDKKRNAYLLRKYGITEAQYNSLLRAQGNRCGVCQRPYSVFKTRLAVDHNHKTGEIRGLLCIHCNRYVIGRHTEPELFRTAYAYLNRGTGWFVPPKKKKKRRRPSRRT